MSTAKERALEAVAELMRASTTLGAWRSPEMREQQQPLYWKRLDDRYVASVGTANARAKRAMDEWNAEARQSFEERRAAADIDRPGRLEELQEANLLSQGKRTAESLRAGGQGRPSRPTARGARRCCWASRRTRATGRRR